MAAHLTEKYGFDEKGIGTMKEPAGERLTMNFEVKSHKEAWVLAQALADWMMAKYHQERKAVGDNAKFKGVLHEQWKLAETLKHRVIDQSLDEWTYKPLEAHLPQSGPTCIKDWSNDESLCPDCDGTGSDDMDGDRPIKCAKCNGIGRIH